MEKPQVGIASVWYEGNPCNMHLLDLAEQARDGVRGGRHGRHALQHHRRQRRHLDGHRRHELLAPVARPHRRLDRDRDVGAVVRREHLDPGLRQEHARLPDGDGPPESPVAHGLRRHDPRRPRRRAREARRHLRVPELRRSSSPASITEGAARRDRAPLVSRAPAPAAACTPPTRWPPPSKRSA